MGEAALGPEEPGRQRGDLTWCLRGRRAQCVEENGLDPPDVDEIEGQGATAGFFQPVGSVLLGQAQKLLSLTELGPGKVSGEEPFGEAADALGELLGLGDHVVWIPASVGAELFGIVVVVGRASSGGLWKMGLDHLPLEEDAHQGTIAANGDRLAEVACRDRVDGPLELDVMVRMNLALGPVRGVEAFTRQRT